MEIGAVGMRRGEIGKNRQRLREVELSHQPDAAVVRGNEIGRGRRALSTSGEGERDDQQRGCAHYRAASLVVPAAGRITPTPSWIAIRVPKGCDNFCSRSRIVFATSALASFGTPRSAPRPV